MGVVVIIGVVLVGATFAALLSGATALATVVVVVAAVVLVDFCLLLAGARARPALLVAVLAGVALPIVVAFDPDQGWARLPFAFAASLLLGFMLLLVFGRRRGVVAGLGATMLAALVVGLGASSIVLLRALPDGFRWVLALLVLVLAADLTPALVSLVRSRRRTDEAADDPDEEALVIPLDAVLPGILLVAATAAALVPLLDPPLTWLTVALLALVSLIAALGGSYMHRALLVEAGLPLRGSRSVRGALTGIADSVLLAAPAAYVIARSAVL